MSLFEAMDVVIASPFCAFNSAFREEAQETWQGGSMRQQQRRQDSDVCTVRWQRKSFCIGSTATILRGLTLASKTGARFSASGTCQVYAIPLQAHHKSWTYFKRAPLYHPVPLVFSALTTYSDAIHNHPYPRICLPTAHMEVELLA